jgi:hypothetical protein
MLERHVRLMRTYLSKTMVAAGFVRPVVSEVARFDVGHEMTVAREAALLAVRRRIDTALEESA